jgi:hypothetical protein
MFIRERWSNRTPGTGRLILLVSVFGSLFIYLVWAAFIAPDTGLPHPVAAEFRLVSVDGKPLPSRRCFRRHVGGRILLGQDGRWQMDVVDCRARYGIWTRAGTYRWSGDTLAVYDHRVSPGEPPLHVLATRSDTLEIPAVYARKKAVLRWVRVRTRSADMSAQPET